MRSLQLVLSLMVLLWSGRAIPISTGFTIRDNPWSFYGNGFGQIVSNMGRENKDSDEVESLWLSCDWGEDHTAFYQWKDLKPGKYRVIYYVKAQDLQLGPDKVSLWNFHDGGKGTVTTFDDLTGTFNWRRVQYEVDVKKSELTLWFRLKGPGQVWVDDFSIEPTKKESIGLMISQPEDEKKKVSYRPFNSPRTKMTTMLFDFSQGQKGHPFSVVNGMGEFKPQKFYDFDLDEININWKKYDRLEMDVFNPNTEFADFNVTLADEQSRDYWSQTNHKQTLAPGWNKIGFSLNQTVGERGSHRSNRSINLSRLKKFYIVIDPDNKQNFISQKFRIDNIKLSANPAPVVPAGVWAFDFTSHKSPTETGMVKVTTQTLFSLDRGYGFSDANFWRVEDSQYASEVLRYSIGLMSGRFKVVLPNGRYQLSLIMDKLGYWDVPFWKERTFTANGKILHRDVRGTGQDFLRDLLRFEKVEPGLNDNPYDLYMDQLFRPIEKTIEVTDGVLELTWSGDESAVSLNTLIIWKSEKEKEAQRYLSEVRQRNKLEFEWMSKPLYIHKEKTKNQTMPIAVVDTSLSLRPDRVLPAADSIIQLSGGQSERPYRILQLVAATKDEVVSWEVKNLINERGEKVPTNALQFSEVIYQFTSPDLNHETYTVAGKFLRLLNENKSTVKAGHNRYLWVQLAIEDKLPKGSYSGEIQFIRGKNKTSIPLRLNILNYSLPPVDFPVGFMGLDPLPYSYFPGKGYSEIRRQYRLGALKKLADAGFTTFTGLPEVNVKNRDNKIELDFTEIDEIFATTKKIGLNGPVYTYGGKFPHSLLDLSKKPQQMNDEHYLKLIGEELQNAFAKKKWPAIIHTFSDEAAGYSDQVKSDMEKLAHLKKNFPFLSLGGFGSFKERSAEALNKSFDYGFYSHIGQREIKWAANQNKKWGLYNISPGNFDDPRIAFGPALYFARRAGLSQYLEWNSFGFNNYPYYELDGREADVVTFYPGSDGRLHPSLRFELAVEGLHFLRKLHLLEKIIREKKTGKYVSSAKAWLDSFRYHYNFTSSDELPLIKKIDFKKINTELNVHLQQLSNT